MKNVFIIVCGLCCHVAVFVANFLAIGNTVARLT